MKTAYIEIDFGKLLIDGLPFHCPKCGKIKVIIERTWKGIKASCAECGTKLKV